MEVKVWLVKVQRAELEARLEHIRYFVVVNLIPHHDAVKVLDKVVLNVKAIPAEFLAIVGES